MVMNWMILEYISNENENIYLTTTDINLNIGLYLQRSKVTAIEV